MLYCVKAANYSFRAILLLVKTTQIFYGVCLIEEPMTEHRSFRTTRISFHHVVSVKSRLFLKTLVF